MKGKTSTIPGLEKWMTGVPLSPDMKQKTDKHDHLQVHLLTLKVTFHLQH